MNFSIKRVWQVFLIRNREFYRDIGTMAWLFIFPVVAIIAFGYLFDPDDIGKPKLALWEGQSPPEIKEFDIITYKTKKKALDKVKKQVVEIAVDYNESPPHVWLAESSPKASLAEKLMRLSLYPEDPNLMQVKRLSGKTIKYIDWLLPGLICMNVLGMALWGVGWVIVRQRKQGVLKRFKASPLTALEYLLGQMISRLLVIVVSGIIVFIMANLIYPFQVQGSFVSLLLVYTLGSMALNGIGLIIAARIASEEFCSGIINFLTYPFIFLSEIWFTLEGASPIIQFLAKISPLWHMTAGMRKIMNEGAGIAELSGSISYLLILSVVCIALGSSMFKWMKD